MLCFLKKFFENTFFSYSRKEAAAEPINVDFVNKVYIFVNKARTLLTFLSLGGTILLHEMLAVGGSDRGCKALG